MSGLDLVALNAAYNECGLCKVTLPAADSLRSIRDAIQAHLRKLTNNDKITLESYHECVTDDQHETLQWDLVNFFWNNDFSMAIGKANYGLFCSFIGPDLHIQRHPYLRIARPGRETDNLGYHRDTFYGQSPFEVTLHIPFTDLDADSCMQFVAESHVAPESAYKVVSMGQASWPKGSKKHEMGFPYQPKKIIGYLGKLRPIQLKFGEAILFTPALIHGQEVNRGPHTRFSVDLRLVNTFAPIKIRDDLSSRGYVALAESAVATNARKYAENCAAADADKPPP